MTLPYPVLSNQWMHFLKRYSSSRLSVLIWVSALLGMIALWLFPPSNRITRVGSLVLFASLWLGLLLAVWRFRFARTGWVGLTVAAALFLSIPGIPIPKGEVLRDDYCRGLQRYNGVTYYWGGESFKGIDCSGLARRGLIDSLFLRGIRNLNPKLIRTALWIWWNDCSAQELGEGTRYTVPLFRVQSLVQLDHSRILPGDLAVTSDGIHVLAYLGNHQWIESDPVLEKVVIVSPSNKESPWLQNPMTLVRWKILTPPF